jgi:heme-degrading monooxygenase HmoA
MVLEIAQFQIVPGQEDDFAAAYAKGRELIAQTPGCRSVRLTRGVESPSRFVLLVEWDSIEAHETGFRASDRFPAWRALITPHFAAAPAVEHYADVAGAH